MRKKSEKKIRQAASELHTSNVYRIDEVRKKAGIIKKVFDKTILDMARLKIVELIDADTDGLDASEIENLVRQGDNLYADFIFLDAEGQPEGKKSEKIVSEVKAEERKPEKIEIVLMEFEPDIWQQFEHLCKTREYKDPIQKIQEMIHDYIVGDD
ncbi:hypothetical protein ACFL6B_04520 [Thermodesulfobacteriota bacterium]